MEIEKNGKRLPEGFARCWEEFRARNCMVETKDT